jgi:hypothetical protein
MTELHVRLEGVNLSNFIHDVHDLSTIRGGSFLLLDAVAAVQEEFGLTPISTGASMGFFSCMTGEKPDQVRTSIERWLHQHEQYRHATFVVDVRPAGDFLRTREELASMNRWRQFQQPALAIPRANAAAMRECSVDRVRPADPSDTDGASISVSIRREHGRHEKQKFYADELRELRRDGTDAALEALIEKVERARFANDLETLTADESKKRLHWKMAVVYFDGNKFGERQRLCRSPDEQRAFDLRVKALRRGALRTLVEQIFASRDNGWWTGETVRLETLLWGGDELIWVVPAWKGWETLRVFYESTAAGDHGSPPLTHAGGVAFCHHTAPIHRIRGMAETLAKVCKRFMDDTKPPETHAARDLFAYQVFESFDLIGESLEDFRAARVPLGRDASELLVRGSTVAAIAHAFPPVRASFPRSKLHDIVFGLREGPQEKLIDDTLARSSDDDQRALRELFHAFGRSTSEKPWHDDLTTWFHIAELWDYALAPEGAAS